ncbi:hypothetical protein [Vibrio sp.]|uniref:hypothetical protein n=1 Tax=Vibrio sp. TaxID=678 RepID=UPI003D0ECDE6
MTTFRLNRISQVKKARTPVQHAVQSHIKREFFGVSIDLTVGEVIAMLKDCTSFLSTLHVVVLINSNSEYQGLVSMKSLLFAEPTEPVSSLCQGVHHYTFALDEDYPAALKLRQSRWPVLPVLDSRHRVVGMLDISAARTIIHRQAEFNTPTVLQPSGWKRLVRFWN